MTDRARVVIGADGLKSFVARSVGAETYNETSAPTCAATTPTGATSDGPSLRDVRSVAIGASPLRPTNDDLTLIVGGWPYAEFEENKKDVEGNYMKMFDLVPAFAERMRSAKREARFVGTAVAELLSQAVRPGWALVGDAGYNKDFITAQGITDAFRDAELCAKRDGRIVRRACARSTTRWATTSATRDEHVLPMYEFTLELATLEPPPPEMQQLLGAVHGNQEACSRRLAVRRRKAAAHGGRCDHPERVPGEGPAALETLKTQIDELRVQADLAQAEARDRLEAAIDSLRTKQGEAKVKLDEAQSTGADTWKTVAKQIEQAVDDLGDTFSKLAGEVQTAVGAAGAAASKGRDAFLDEWKKARTEPRTAPPRLIGQG